MSKTVLQENGTLAEVQEDISLQKQKQQQDLKTSDSLQAEKQQDLKTFALQQEQLEKQKTQLSWTDEPQLKEEDRIAYVRDNRIQFTQREKQEFDEEERILLDREQQSVSRLSLLLEEANGSGYHGFSFRRTLRKIRRELSHALGIFSVIRENREEPAKINALREEYQNKLELIYQLGENFLKEKESEPEQEELLRKIMEAADNAQLPSSRVLLIRKERQYRMEDEKGYDHAEKNEDVNGLKSSIKKAIKFYTDAKVIHGNMPGYKFMNQLLRGQIKESDLPKENGLNKKILEMIRRLNQAFGVIKQNETKRLYRGLNLRTQYKDQINHPESLVGRVLVDNAYMSTSRNRDKSLNFLNIEGIQEAAIDQFVKIRMKDPDAPPPERMITGHSLLEITAREGAHGLDIAAVSEVESEEEVLFPPGTMVYLRSMEFSNHVIIVFPETIKKRVKATYGETADQVLNKVLSPNEKFVHINVAVPVFQGEIR